jgi:hypothetical protein
MQNNIIVESLFINFSKKEIDVRIAEDIIIQLQATKKFKNQNILDSSDLGGDEAEESLMLKVEKSGAVIHLLSAYFQVESCRKALDKCIETKKTMFPILIGTFPYEFDSTLESINENLLPVDKKDIPLFNDEAKRAEVITRIIEKIYNELGIEEYSFKDRRGNNRKFVYGTIIGLGILASLSAYGIFKRISNWELLCIVPLATLVIIFYLIYKLRNPSSISLYKTAKS